MSKENGFLKGAAVLGMAAVVVKILGAIYRVPLSNMIMSEGMGYYQTAYPFYVLLLAISTSGFPVAIAKIVSEKRSKGDYKSAFKVFKTALYILSILGLVSGVFLFFNAKKIVTNLNNPNAYYALVALSPALIFVPIMSVFRGFFQGQNTMVPTAISQMSEQLFRVGAGLYITYSLLDYGIPMAAGGASSGGTIGAIAGTIAVVGIYFYKRKSIMAEVETSLDYKEYKTKDIVKDLFIIAIPITFGASILPLMDYIDLKLVLTRLPLIGINEATANELYGNLKGMAQTLINLPQVFSTAIAMSIVPVISAAKARADKDGIENIVNSGIRVTLLIGLPAAIGLFVLSQPIIELLFFKNSPETMITTGKMLRILSVGVIFLTLVQTTSGMLQGLGRPIEPAKNLLVGALIKGILTYFLTTIPSVNIYGAAFSTVVAYLIATSLNLKSLRSHEKVKFELNKILTKPLLSAIGMGLGVQISYMGLTRLSIIKPKLVTMVSILIGGCLYLVFLGMTGAITDEDLKLLPKGDKIGKVLNKIKIKK